MQGHNGGWADARTQWICLLSPAAAAPVRVPMLLTVRVVGIVLKCVVSGSHMLED